MIAKKKLKLNTYSSNDNKFQLYNGSLKIINLSSGDKGHYTCEAKNAFGSKRIVYDLSVDMPYIDESLDPSLLSITPAEKPIIERNMFDDVTLKCNATGKTTPTVAWYYNNKRIGMTIIDGQQWEFSDKNKFLLLNGDLRIIDLSLDDGGHYRCEAINKYGLKSIWYSLTVKPIESKYQWISSDERRANFANRKLIKVNSGLSNDSYYISRVKDNIAYNRAAFVPRSTGIASYNDLFFGKRQTTNYELLESYGNYEWKRVINQTVPYGAVVVDNLHSLIGRKNNYSMTKIRTYGIRHDEIDDLDDLEILIVT
ncbi:hypothetical protein HCN44_005010 [Aphidius gifuensis]|uniref:Ig-like domain-containing protein n=1 Tax=Aphidius gifuensis TaxID=684658 RepID=A0A834XTU5_APHGI|nr:hypothetical protein HCN44_005010 [Aphidius gifuensis]